MCWLQLLLATRFSLPLLLLLLVFPCSTWQECESACQSSYASGNPTTVWCVAVGRAAAAIGVLLEHGPRIRSALHLPRPPLAAGRGTTPARALTRCSATSASMASGP